MKLQKYCPIFVQLWWLLLAETMAFKSLDLLSHRCQHNTKYVEGFNLSMPENRISCVMRTRIKIPATVKFYISLERGQDRAGPYNTFFKYDVDFCKLISSYRNNLFKRWTNSLAKHGHMPSRCPWPVDEYYLRDWQLSKDLIPPFVVSGVYRSKIITYLGSFGSDSYENLIECEAISQLI